MPHAHTNATGLDGGVITLTDPNYSTVILLCPLVCLNSEPRSGSLFSQRFQIKTNSVHFPSVSNTLHIPPKALGEAGRKVYQALHWSHSSEKWALRLMTTWVRNFTMGSVCSNT
ncbi:hypothetical protein VTO58DRAFT_110978 [Aureobasidium pullulans]